MILFFKARKKFKIKFLGFLKTYGGVIESFHERGIAKWPGALLQQ